jgi:hypothetical protein
MAKIIINRSMALVALTDSVENEYEFKSSVVLSSNNGLQDLYIRVITGPIKFSVYDAIGVATDVISLADGEDMMVTIANGKRNLLAKGANGLSFMASI